MAVFLSSTLMHHANRFFHIKLVLTALAVNEREAHIDVYYYSWLHAVLILEHRCHWNDWKKHACVTVMQRNVTYRKMSPRLVAATAGAG